MIPKKIIIAACVCVLSLIAANAILMINLFTRSGSRVQDCYYRDIHYIVLSTSGGMSVRNYTLDSIELNLHQKYGGYHGKQEDTEQPSETSEIVYRREVRDVGPWEKYGAPPAPQTVP